jgi:hypothetical protein
VLGRPVELPAVLHIAVSEAVGDERTLLVTARTSPRRQANRAAPLLRIDRRCGGDAYLYVESRRVLCRASRRTPGIEVRLFQNRTHDVHVMSVAL